MSGRDAVHPASIGWTRIWALFDAGEQRELLGAFWDAWREGELDRDLVVGLMGRLAEALKHRRERVLKFTRTQLVRELHPRAAKLFDDECWEALFRCYYPRHKRDLMCSFLNLVGIEHDERGLIPGDFDAPGIERGQEAVAGLLKSFTAREVGRYLAILLKQNDGWHALEPEVGRLLALVDAENQEPSGGGDAVGTDPSGASAEFTVLDRVLINEIVRSITGIAGALAEDELAELIESVIGLNETRQWTYFHLGLMDVLCPERAPDFERPELNDTRREWYLAGVLTGVVRKRDVGGLRDLLTARSVDFARAAAKPGGAGASMAKTGFQVLAESGQLSDAAMLLRGQLAALGMTLAGPALKLATSYVRQNEFGSARTLINILRQPTALIRGDAEELVAFRHELERRWGQCLQAAGDFDGAERAFKQLNKEGGESGSPDLLADLGLVKGRFRSLAQVHLPETREQRTNLRDALAKGESYFQQAVAAHRVEAPQACFALAMLAYLRYALEKPGAPRRETLRIEALNRVRDAVTAIHQSESARAYEEMGVLGQARFLQAVVQMSSLDPVDSRAAMDAWRGITEAAGRFPKAELRELVEVAEAVDPQMATDIAETVWAHRPEDAPEILATSSLRAGSDLLQNQMLAQARQENLPRSRRMELWCWLVPALIRRNELEAAKEGLDILEGLAEDPSLVEPLLKWFSEPGKCDSVLSPGEVSWIRVRLLRRLGRDAECSNELRQLFFQVRDNRPFDAAQVLETFRDWRLEPSVYADLESRVPAAAECADRDVETRLAQGESVRVLFVGGNETQAQYDEAVREVIRREWPGVTLVFEHSGWSSNWGRDVPRLLNMAKESDAVVLMYMMRTMLGRTLREKIDRPWVPCTSTGKGGMLSSIRRAAVVAVELNRKRRGAAIA